MCIGDFPLHTTFNIKHNSIGGDFNLAVEAK